jgi:DNA-directed RNA polymerase specialized sigma24 family protein
VVVASVLSAITVAIAVIAPVEMSAVCAAASALLAAGMYSRALRGPRDQNDARPCDERGQVMTDDEFGALSQDAVDGDPGARGRALELGERAMAKGAARIALVGCSVDDVVQEAKYRLLRYGFTRVFTNLDAWRAYCFTVGRHTAVKMTTVGSRWVKLSQLLPRIGGLSSRGSHGDNELFKRIAREVERWSDLDQRLFWAIYDNPNASQQEIANIAGCARETANRHLGQLRDRLNDALEIDDWGEETDVEA